MLERERRWLSHNRIEKIDSLRLWERGKNRLGRRGELLAMELKAARTGVDNHFGAVADLAGQQLAAQRGFQLTLDHPPQRTRAVNRIVAAFGEVVARLVGQIELDLALAQPLPQLAELDIHNLAQLLLGQRMEHHDLVDPVEELRPE